MSTTYQKLKNTFAEVSQLTSIQHLMLWDEAVMMPLGGGEARANSLATLNGVIQKRISERKIQKWIAAAKQESLSPWDAMNLQWIEKQYIRAQCVPVKLAEKLTRETMRCEQAWRKLRTENNWKKFLPYLKKSFAAVKEIAKRQAEALQLELYDSQIDIYAPGFNQKIIDPVFADLKNQIPVLIKKIVDKQKTFLKPRGPFAIASQRELGLQVAKALQFDFERGRLDVSHHPFCTGTPTDVRMTTRYTEDDFISSLLGICHESGHGLYDQGLPLDWMDQPVGQARSMAVHESQSLLIEMQVCRSRAFCEFLAPLVAKHFGMQEAFSVENLYHFVSYVEPSLIRVDADEVTYPLHIVLRYEIEKKLFNDELKLEDLPGYWNESFEKYFGISTLGNDKNGVMQDVHWPSGAFGYFPAYTLGRLIAAQLFNTFTQSNTNFMNQAKQGDFSQLITWLRKHVHSQASSVDVNTLLRNATGSELNANHFIQHVCTKYEV